MLRNGAGCRMIVQNASRRTVLSAEWCCRVDRVDRASSLELHLNLASSSSSSSIGQHLPNFFQRISSVRKGKQNARICLPNSQCEFHTARISLCHDLCTSAARDLWLSLIALFSMQFELFRNFRPLSPNFLCIQKFAAVRLGPLMKPLISRLGGHSQSISPIGNPSGPIVLSNSRTHFANKWIS